MIYAAAKRNVHRSAKQQDKEQSDNGAAPQKEREQYHEHQIADAERRTADDAAMNCPLPPRRSKRSGSDGAKDNVARVEMIERRIRRMDEAATEMQRQQVWLRAASSCDCASLSACGRIAPL